MKFIDCPRCGMKNIDSVSLCKSCQKPLLEGNDSVADVKKPKPEDPALDSLIVDRSGGDEADDEELETFEVVRNIDEDPAVDPTRKQWVKEGVEYIRIAEEKESVGPFGSNFWRNIFPRLIRISFITFFIALTLSGITIYNIMDTPRFYNYFHMHSELTKSFPETLKYLKVFENAGSNPRLKYQRDEISELFLNKYLKWMLLISKVDRLPESSEYNDVYVFKVRENNRTMEFHNVKLYMNQRMSNKLKKVPLKINSDQTCVVTGRIIGWSRAPGSPSLEISVYDAEVTW